MGCLDEDTILALVDGGLDDAARSSVETHLASCAECSEVVAGAATGSEGDGASGPLDGSREIAGGTPPARTGLARGANVGRYVILDLVGRGGMGEVYAAYDPQLDRRIALKLLHDGAGGEAPGSAGRERLLREAKAIARLSHQNVVVVHDAGAIVDSNQVKRVFLAMEFVDGQTLAEWLAVEPRSWRQVRDVFAAAGEGLAAAHDAGLVHRDFKPQNVMVGRDGSVRVMDFGLAGDSAAGKGELLDPLSLPDVPPTAHTAALTRTGALLGTPLYMAPEQFLARPTDARTDQFSFCVALFEAVTGERPFPSESFAILLEAVVAGRVREPAQRARVPAFLRRLIGRGLKADPEARWPSMRALLAALRHDPVRRRRGLALSASALALVAGVAVGAQRLATRGQRVCLGGADKLAGVWDLAGAGDRRQAVRQALFAAGGAGAEETWGRVSRLLDDYGRRWLAMYSDSCEATHVRGEQSAEVLDLRTSCLEGPRAALRALTGVLARADAAIAAGAINAVQALPPLDRCADVMALRAVVPPPRDAAARAKVEALRPELAEVKALTDTGKWDEARRRVGPLLDSARAIGYAPLTSEAAAAGGWLETLTGEMKRATSLHEESLWSALAASRDDLALQAAAVLEGEYGYHLGRFEDADRWDRFGRALLERLGPGHELAEAWLLHDRGISRAARGDYEAGLKDVLAALALKRKALPADHPDIAISLMSVSDLREGAGDIRGALEASEQAVEAAARAYGSRSPSMAQFLYNRGEVLNLAGRNAEAEQDLREALARWSAWLGPEHPYVGYGESTLGKTLLDLRRPREAVSVLERALAVREKSEPKPELVAETRFALARARFEAGEASSAIALAEAAREAYRKVPSQAKRVEEIDGWLAVHGAPKRRGTP